MTAVADVALRAAERIEELEAAQPVLYGALDRIRKYLASADRLKLDDPEEVLAGIRLCAREATDAVDAVTLATQTRGMEIVDTEALQQAEAYGFQALSPKGKLLVIAARKRAALRPAAPTHPTTLRIA